MLVRWRGWYPSKAYSQASEALQEQLLGASRAGQALSCANAQPLRLAASQRALLPRPSGISRRNYMNRGGSAKERLILGIMAAGAAIAGARQGRHHRKAAVSLRGFYKATGWLAPFGNLLEKNDVGRWVVLSAATRAIQWPPPPHRHPRGVHMLQERQHNFAKKTQFTQTFPNYDLSTQVEINALFVGCFGPSNGVEKVDALANRFLVASGMVFLSFL